MKDQPVTIRNLSNTSNPPIRVKWCESFLCKLRGYTFRSSLDREEGLLMAERRDSRVDTSIHMMFVWTDLAVIWINSQNKVVDRVLAKSWRPFYASREPARYILEIHPERLDEFKPGDIVEFKYG